ncbi:DUF4381 domain-containing protein [Porticoccus sp.]
MNPQDPLAQLRDIHLPEPVGWWPPAPGWWLLALLLIATLIFTVRWLIMHQRANRYRREALLALTQLETAHARQPLERCQAILALLRRTAKTAYPGQGLESELLPRLLTRLNLGCRKPPFDEALQHQLRDLPYQANPQIPEGALDGLQTLAKHWIKRHRRGRPC